MDRGFQALADDLKALFSAGVLDPWPDGAFGDWALRVFEHQFESNATYAAYARKRGVTPTTITGWEQIPAVPTSAFKAVPLISGEASRVQRVFLTSGTTRGRGARGEHHVLDLDLYRASLVPNLRAHLYPDGAALRVLALLPAPAQAPESSLSFMIGEVLDSLSDGDGGFYVDASGRLDVAGLRAALGDATAEGRPVLMAGTAFAFVHWLDALAGSGHELVLPPGSRVLETGGFKGRSRTLSREDLYDALSSAHGVPVNSIVNEYGMTELLSQFYEPTLRAPHDSVENRTHAAPPWMRTRVLDPATLDPVPSGRPGLLCHYDLANAGSVMAVLTEDMGVSDENGLRILGRAEGSEPRGCSLAMDDLLSAMGSA